MKNKVLKPSKPCKNLQPLSETEIEFHMATLVGWTLGNDPLQLIKKYTFQDYYQTIAFVNAAAWLAHQVNHHPNLWVAYCTCEVKYYTHTLNGLSATDFFCAAKIDELVNDINV